AICRSYFMRVPLSQLTSLFLTYSSVDGCLENIPNFRHAATEKPAPIGVPIGTAIRLSSIESLQYDTAASMTFTAKTVSIAATTANAPIATTADPNANVTAPSKN